MMTLFSYLNLDPDEMKDSILGSNLDATLKAAMVLFLNEFMENEREGFLLLRIYINLGAKFISRRLLW